MYDVDRGLSRYAAHERVQPPLEALWESNPLAGPKTGKRIKGRFLESPLVFQERLFTWGHGRKTLPAVYCLSVSDGSPIWRFENDIVELLSIACISQGVLILGGTHGERARGIDANSGQLLWSNSSAPLYGQHICLDDGRVVFSGLKSHSVVYGLLSPENGDVLWSKTTPDICQSVGACDLGLLFVEERTGAEFNGVICRDWNSGAALWERDFSRIGRHMSLSTKETVPGRPGAVVSSGDAVYCNVSRGTSNQLYCLAAKDGRILWELECAPGPMQPVVGDQELFWVSFTGEYYRADARTGHVLVHTHLPGGASSNQTTAIVANGYYWYGYRTELRAIATSTGELGWRWSDRAQVTEPSVAGGRVYISSLAPHILCFGSVGF
jgi:outer membrane protein assembly factor BamB